MNYIKKIEADLANRDAQLKAYEEGITELYGYLNSPKFQGEGEAYVNISDVFLRLREIQATVFNVQVTGKPY